MHLLLILRREHVREVGLPVTLEELGAGKVTSQILGLNEKVTSTVYCCR